MITSKPLTPSTSTHTSLKDRPTLRTMLRALWVVVVVYVLYVLASGISTYTNGLSGNTNILRQIARLGFSLLSISTKTIDNS